MAEPTERDREMRKAFVAVGDYNLDALDRLLAAVREEGRRAAIEECAKIALAAQLPTGYQWGHDAMEQFNFGKKRAAEAILALVPKEPK